MKKKKDKSTYSISIFAGGLFSWERPIEEEILQFCRHMAIYMEKASVHHKETGWFANNRLSEDAETMAKAYRTVEKHIEREIKFRKKLEE